MNVLRMLSHPFTHRHQRRRRPGVGVIDLCIPRRNADHFRARFTPDLPNAGTLRIPGTACFREVTAAATAEEAVEAVLRHYTRAVGSDD